MIHHKLGGVVLVLLGAVPAFGQTSGAVGRVKVASGTVVVVRAGAQQPVQAGQMVFEADVLRTGADGRVGVTLKDDTRVSLGPASEVRLQRFSYAPAEGQLSLVLQVIRGAVAYVSGHIAKLAPESIRLEAPTAILGVRGTTLAMLVENN